MERKSKAVIVVSACSIVWGVMFFLFLRFFPRSLYSVIDVNYLMSYSQEELDNMKQTLTGLNNLIHNGALVLLILLLVLKIIVQIKSGYGFKEKNMIVYSTEILIAASVMHLFGAIGVSWIFVILSGIIGIIGSIKENKGISKE